MAVDVVVAVVVHVDDAAVVDVVVDVLDVVVDVVGGVVDVVGGCC